MRGNKFFKFLDIAGGLLLQGILKISSLIIYPFRAVFSGKGKDFLIIKLSAMGDTILLLPVIKKLKKEFPGSRITMVVTKINSGVAQASGLADEVIIFDLKWLANPVKLFSFIARLQSLRVFCALDFDQWLRISPIIAFLSGAGKRIGFKTRGQFRHFLYTESVEHSAEKHEIDCFFDIITKLGLNIGTQDRELFFETPSQDEIIAAEKIRQLGINGGYAVIHPGCGSHGRQRQWPEEKYVEIINYLRLKSIVPVISVGPGEDPVYEKIYSMAGGVLPSVRNEKLTVLASIIKNSSVFISGNTGVMHLAAAVKARVIGLHGPTDPAKWAPLGKNSTVISSCTECSPCLYLGSEYGCKGRACMEAISADEVIKHIEKSI